MHTEEKLALSGELDRFFGDLGFRLELFESARRKLDVYLASEFNVFSYIAPDENRLSDIIAELLNPEGKHGQGEVFLREFLKVLRVEPQGHGRCRVVREQATAFIPQSQRRIDILVDIDGFGIGIENKPWAGEQPDQLSAYWEYLRARYGDRCLLVYLSGGGDHPQSIPAEEWERLKGEGKLKVLAYSGAFKEWLVSCYKECSAEKVRWFLRDFVDFVEGTFRNQPEESGGEEHGR